MSIEQAVARSSPLRRCRFQLSQSDIISSVEVSLGAALESPVAAVWPVANLAIFVPIRIDGQITLKRILVQVAVASGNMDVGIYREDKTKVISSGSMPAMMDGITQAVNIVNTGLSAGRYYMGMAVDNITFQALRLGSGGGYNRLYGVNEKTSSFPLPSPAVWYEHASRIYVPSFALDTGGGQITPTFVGVSANASAASGDLVVTPPTTVADDIMICAVATNDNVALTFPAGWTIYQEGNNGAAVRSTLAWKRAAGVEAAFTITHTAGATISANVVVYRGCVATGSPINASSLRHNGSSATCTADAITPSVPNCLIVLTAHTRGVVTSSAQAATDPATLTERFDNAALAVVSGADGFNLAGGSTGNATTTLSAAVENSSGLTALTPLVK